jgi:hypothetical protein
MRVELQGVPVSSVQKYLTVSGTVAVITSVLVGSTVGLIGAVASDHSSWVAFPAGVGTSLIAVALLMHYLNTQMKTARLGMGRYGPNVPRLV